MWSVCGLSVTEIMDYTGDTQTRAGVFNTLKYRIELSMFTYPVPTSEKTLRLDYKGQQPVYHTTLKINCGIFLHCINQMLCGNVPAACSENGMKTTKTVSVSTILNVNGGGEYSYHCALQA